MTASPRNASSVGPARGGAASRPPSPGLRQRRRSGPGAVYAVNLGVVESPSPAEPADPDDLYPAHLRTLMDRTEAALAGAGCDGLIIPAGQPVAMPFDDQHYSFRASPWYRWWVPQADPGACVVVEPGRAPRLLLPQSEDFWHMPREVPRDGWAHQFRICPVRSSRELVQHIPPDRRWAVLGDAKALPELGISSPPALVHHLEYDRAIKTPYEISCIRGANTRAARAHRAAGQAFLEGAGEFDVHLAYCRALRERESELPYDNIVAIGRHAAVLHYQLLDRGVRPGTGSLLLDAGASARGYAADISRTHLRTPNPEMAALIAALDRLQQDLCARIRPAQDYVEIHLQAHLGIGAVLRDAGLIRVDGPAAVVSGLTSVFFPHGVGHLLGLQVHDVGGLLADRHGALRPRPDGHPYLRLTRRLEAGFAVTIEPGIYFIETLLARAAGGTLRTLIDWSRVDALRDFGGIRIEDDVVVTTTAPENLTRAAFSALDAAH